VVRDRGDRHVDYPGALLCALGLGGPVFALIEQPRFGWSSPAVSGPLIAGALLLAVFIFYESRAKDPMLPLVLFRRRNFSAGNIETFAMYAGLAILFFFLVLFLQQIGGYSPLKSGLATLPVTVVMFLLSRRFGALADRFGPRFFMGVGPIVAGAGLALLTRVQPDLSYATDLLPPLLVFAVGLSMTVAPLTATVLAGADENNAGIASGVNNAIARVAGLLGIAIVGAIVAARYGDSADASTGAFHLAMGISAGLVGLGGVMGLIGIQNPQRKVDARGCSGGHLAGAPREAARARARARAGEAASERPAPAGVAP
jgi:predicted MFS family arabinose efflux permease